jgi:hypothetical protein
MPPILAASVRDGPSGLDLQRGSHGDLKRALHDELLLRGSKTTLAATATAGLIGPLHLNAQDGRLETTTVRIGKIAGICISPQYVLLRNCFVQRLYRQSRDRLRFRGERFEVWRCPHGGSSTSLHQRPSRALPRRWRH